MDGSTGKSGLAGTYSQQDFTQWLLPNFSADELRSCPTPDATSDSIAYCQLDRKMAIKGTYRPYTHHTWMCTLLKSNIVMTHHRVSDTRPEQQLAKATEKHIRLMHALQGQVAQRCHKASLHTILIGVMGTIYKYCTELPPSKLGLDL